MPIDLSVRKALDSQVGIHRSFEDWAAVLTALCFVVALAGLVTHTPKTYRADLSPAVYEAMLQSP